MSKNRRETRIFCRGLDQIYDAARKIAKDWSTKTIPVLSLQEIIKLSKLRNPKKGLHQFYKDYNEILDALFKECKKSADIMGSKHVSLGTLLMWISKAKSAFIEGRG